MKYTEAVTCVLDGLKLANETYEKWSGGDWMGRAGVEGFLVAKIGERLHDRITANGVDEYITLEASMKTVGEDSGSPARKRPEYIKKVLDSTRPKRIDITLWNDEGEPQGVFEIKRCWDFNGCFNDLLRVAAMVRQHGRANDGSIEWGFVAFFINAETTKNDDSLDEKTSRCEDKVREKFKRSIISKNLDLTFKYGPVMDSEYEEDGKKVKWEGQGVCMAVRPKKG